MATLAALDILIQANSTRFKSDMDKAAAIAERGGQNIQAAMLRATDKGTAAFKGLANSIGSLSNPLEALAGSLNNVGAAVGLGAATAAISGMVASAVHMGGEMADLSIKTGVSVEQLSRFSTVAKLSGTDMDTVAGVMKKLSISAVEAATGNDKLANVYKALGLSVQELRQLSPDELMIRVAQGIRGIDPKIMQDLLAQIGGKNASSALSFMRELNERLDDTHVKISTQFAADAKEFEDNMVLMGAAAGGFGRALASQVLPQLNSLMDTLRNASKNGEGFFGSILAGLKHDIAIMGVDFTKVPQEIDKAQEQLKTATGLEKNQLEARLKILQDYKSKTDTALANPIDAAKTDTAEKILKQNQNLSGAKAGDAFLQGLRERITKGLSGEYAQLLAQAEEKGVKGKAAPLINELRALDESNSVKNYVASLSLATQEYRNQVAQIGMTKDQIELANVASRMSVELQKEITQIERTKGALTAETRAEMEAQKEAAVLTIQTLIKARQSADKTFEGGMNKSFNTYLENAENMGKHVEATFTNAFGNMENAMVAFASTGKASFADMANAIIGDIMRMFIRYSLIAPLMRSFGFGVPTGQVPTTTPLPDANGDAFIGGARVRAFATGGVVSRPTYFGSAEGPSVMGEAGPEAIMPLGRDANGRLGVRASGGGGGNVTVIVNNNADNSQATARESTDAFGNRQIEILVANMVNKAISSGKTDNAMRASYGMRRVAS